MRSVVGLLTGLLVLGVFQAGAARSQSWDQPPTYGAYALSSGFSPSPKVIKVRSGGRTDITEKFPPPCVGFIAQAPDVDINYTAGEAALVFTVLSGRDTTLIINDPDGVWYCDDDSGGNEGPRVVFTRPKTGNYNVWIGSYAARANFDAELHISERPRP